MDNSIAWPPHRVTVDLDQRSSIDTFEVNQLNRLTNIVEIDVVRSGNDIDIAGCTARIVIRKPSGMTIFDDCEIISTFPAKLRYKMTTQAHIEESMHVAEVMIFYDMEQEVAVSGLFMYTVRPGIMDDGTIKSQNDWQAIHNALLNYISRDEADKVVSEIIRNMSADGTLPIDLSAYLEDYLTKEEIERLFVSITDFKDHVENEEIHLNKEDVKGIVEGTVSVIEGPSGDDGLSAYEIAVQNGFIGTEEEWLESLIGKPGQDGKSAFEFATEGGYEGTAEEFYQDLAAVGGLANAILSIVGGDNDDD